MSAVSGSDFLLQVETTPGGNTFILVANFNAYGKRSTQSETRYPVFGNPVPLTSPTPNEQTMTAGGLIDLTDPGQALLRAAEANRTPIRIRTLKDGAVGEVQTVRVGSFAHDARPESLQTIAYELTAVDTAAAFNLAQDGSVADLQNVFGDANIVGIWDLSDIAKVHVNGSTQIDSVDDARGAGVGLPISGALADGTLGSWKPGWDAVNKRAVFTLGQPTQTRFHTALDARYSLAGQSLALIVWGGFNAGSGSYAIRILHSDGLRGAGLIGAFGHPTFDFLLTTDATHQYQSGFPQGNRVVPNVAGPSPRSIVMSVKRPVIAASGFEGSFPFHSIESPGNERVVMLASALNEWTPPIAGNYQIIIGGAVAEGYLRGMALVKLDAFQDAALSRDHMAAIERFGARIGTGVTNTAGAKGVTIDGDSRPWGNGAANANTDTIQEQLQVLLDAAAPGVYHTQNRGIEGDSWHDRANLHVGRVYTPEYWRQRATNDKDTNRPTPGDIHVYVLDVNDTNSGGGGTFGNTTASADICLAQFDVEFAALVADGKRVIVCGPIAPIVDPFRTQWLNGLLARAAANPTTLAIARTDQDARLANPADTTYFTDGLHQTPAGMGVFAAVINATRIAKGW